MDEMYLQKEVQYHEGKLFGSNEEGTTFRAIMKFMIVGLRNNVSYVVKAIPKLKGSSCQKTLKTAHNLFTMQV